MRPAREESWEPAISSTATDGRLSFWDGVSLMIGIVVGVTIFEAPPAVFNNVPGPWHGMGIWLLGGILSLIGALCYAELATAYPRTGGDYVYLTEAFGPCAGFLFGWAQLAAVLTSSTGAMAYVFANYAAALWELETRHIVLLAILPVVVLSLVNMLGITCGKTVQNLLTLAKLSGVLAIILAGLAYGGDSPASAQAPVAGLGWRFAVILVLYAYGGWNDTAFVAAEVRSPRRNIPRVLVVGTAAITLIYLLVNLAYLFALGFDGLRSSKTPATDVLRLMLGENGSQWMSILVMVSALGAVNGIILTGSRVYATLGSEHRVFAWLGHWNSSWGVPTRSIAAQAVVTVALIALVGTETGRQWVDWGVQTIGLGSLPWQDYGGGFSLLVSATAPVFWLFFLGTGLALFILRRRQPHVERPFSVPFYPWLPITFCLMCCFMLYASLTYAKALALLGIVPVLCGLPLYWVGGGRK